MKKNSFILILLLAHSFTLMSQEFTVKVSVYEVLMGNYIEITYHIEDLSGDFKPPKFTGFDIVAGPNHTSSFSLTFGKMTQSHSYSYKLRPKSEGILIIEPAFLQLENDVLSTEIIEILVKPNPNGLSEPLQQRKEQDNPLERRQQLETPKNKRPITKL